MFGLSLRRRIVLGFDVVIQSVKLSVWQAACRVDTGDQHMMMANVFVCALLGVAGNVCQLTLQPEQHYLPRPSYLARGDPAAGRRAYITLKCNVCHTVAGETIGAAKPPKLPGPQLGKSVALESPQQIADSIAAPGHTISQKPGPWHRSAGSNMGDYTNIMTVRQLIDLVAYLRSLN